MGLLWAKVGRLLPTWQADGTNIPLRAGPYGALYTLPLDDPLMGTMEGTYYAGTTTPSGTPTNPSWTVTTAGVAMLPNAGASQAYVSTTAAMLMYNNSSTGNIKLKPHFIRFTFNTAGVAQTSVQVGLVIDPSNRYSSGGTAITGYNCNTDVSTSSVASIYLGNVTCTAAGASARPLARATVKTAAAPATATSIGDQVTFWFGQPAGSAATLSGTAASQSDHVFPGVSIGAGHSLILHCWMPSETTSPDVDISMGWWER